MLEKTKFSISKQLLSKSIMAAQKCKKIVSAEIYGIFECLLTQNPSNQSSLLLIIQDHMENYEKIQKQQSLGVYFCLKVTSKLAPQ